MEYKSRATNQAIKITLMPTILVFIIQYRCEVCDVSELKRQKPELHKMPAVFLRGNG